MGNILLLHSSAGSGHRSVATAIAEALKLPALKEPGEGALAGSTGDACLGTAGEPIEDTRVGTAGGLPGKQGRARSGEPDETPDREQGRDGIGERGGVPVLRAGVADILDFASPRYRALYGRGYEFCAKYARWFVHAVFALTDRPWPDSVLVRASEAATAAPIRGLSAYLRENGISVVCCTHFLPVTYLCRLRREGLYRGAVHACVTDYDVHGFWFDPDVDFYHVASPQALRRLRDWGVDRTKIGLSGIPVRGDFVEGCTRVSPVPESAGDTGGMMVAAGSPGSSLSTGSTGTDNGVGEGRLRVLLAASSLRVRECLEILDEIARSGVSCAVDLVTGRNQALYRALERRERHGARGSLRLLVHGFVREMAALMRESDLMITKPGGITVSEGLVRGLPMLFVAPIPMHEVHNARILEEQGAGSLCSSGETWRRMCASLPLVPRN